MSELRCIPRSSAADRDLPCIISGGSSDDKGLSRSVRVDDQFGRRCGSFCAGDEVDAALTGVQMLKPPARKNDSANSLVDICWATTDS
jgi:hypothetical protein